ncbi:MAG: hypothetical protein KKA62_01525 [Nanoarchaeota archaeon]|nr:hypothetical protein [Nanoarchaeota archaeon]MBU1643608.1 hypothetical protein [Nanoarchaeota archaeon]MBU1976613.1 hypothetical protein [Nanoarchaeota archaeon]
MVKNHTFRFRITKTQFEEIRQEAKVQGYLTIAPYLRDIAFNKNRFIESKIIETNVLVKKIMEMLQDGRK